MGFVEFRVQLPSSSASKLSVRLDPVCAIVPLLGRWSVWISFVVFPPRVEKLPKTGLCQAFDLFGRLREKYGTSPTLLAVIPRLTLYLPNVWRQEMLEQYEALIVGIDAHIEVQPGQEHRIGAAPGRRRERAERAILELDTERGEGAFGPPASTTT